VTELAMTPIHIFLFILFDYFHAYSVTSLSVCCSHVHHLVARSTFHKSATSSFCI